MIILLRFLAGIVGAIVGVVLAFVLDLTVGDGVRFIPISEFIIPLVIGGVVGFCLGFVFYRVTGKLFVFLSRFSVEPSP